MTPSLLAGFLAISRYMPWSKKLMLRTTLFCTIILFPFVAAAQAPATWEAVKTLAPGTQIRVTSTISHKAVEGTVESVTDSDLVLSRHGDPQSFQRPQITSVSVRKSGHRIRNTLIGLGVGTAAGFLIGTAVGHAQESSCMKSGGWFCGLDQIVPAGVGGVSGLVGGTLAGAFWSPGWRKIYAP
jgi:hypothetical protein